MHWLLSVNKTACLHTVSPSPLHPLSHHAPTSVHVCAHMCVCVGEAFICLFVCLETEFLAWLLLSLARLSVQPAPGILPVCFCLPSAEIMKMCHCLGIFVWLLGVELSSLCLHGNHLQQNGLLPSPLFSFCDPGFSASAEWWGEWL